MVTIAGRVVTVLSTASSVTPANTGLKAGRIEIYLTETSFREDGHSAGSNQWRMNRSQIKKSEKPLRLGSTTKAVRSLLVLLGTLGALWAACIFLRISSSSDVDAYLGMASECSPVWKEFAFRRFGAGSSAAELFRRFPPSGREEFGRYGIYSFTSDPSNKLAFTRFSVVTKDGKLISASSGSCTWRFTFFTTEDPELNRQFAVYQQERHREFEKKRLKQLETDLQRFFLEYSRWPTNEMEFYYFVTGEKPPSDQSITYANMLRAKYGLRGQKTGSELPTPLGITLKLREGGSLDIAINGEAGLTSNVVKPNH